MAAVDLTTPAAVQAWLGVDCGDALLQALVTGASTLICNYTGRASFQVVTVTDLYDGNGKDWQLLRQWPVQSITSITFLDGSPAPSAAAAGVPLNNGWQLEAPLPAGGNQRLSLFGYRFPRGRSNVQVVYEAGYTAVPADVAQACVELAGEAYSRKDRIGTVSKTLGGQETVSFSQKDMNESIRTTLAAYVRRVPC
jgi:hypothetical protein